MSIQSEHIRVLREVGLSDNEARVYLGLSGVGVGTAYEVAREASVKIPTAYVILEELRRKGLVLKVPHAKKALFSARDIREYVAEQKQKLQMVESIAPQLGTLSGQKENVFFFNGIRGIEQAINYKLEAMRGKKIYGFYSNLADAPPEMLKLYGAWDRKCLEMDISFAIIMAKKGAGKYYKDIFDLSKRNSNLQIRLLEQYDYPENQTIDMAQDFVRIVDEKRLYATIIDDKNTARAMRQIFNIVWEKGV